MAAARQGLPVRLDRVPQRGAAFAITRASRRARTRSIGSRSRARGSSLIFTLPPPALPGRPRAEAVWREAIARWPGATPMQDDRGAMGAKAKSGYSRYGDIHRRDECAGWEKTMFLLARYTVAAAVFLSASAASAVE